VVRLNSWRRLKRADLLQRRQVISPEYRRHAQAAVEKHIVEQLYDIRNAAIGFYWPIKGEIDLRKLITRYLLSGAKAALPVIRGMKEPLQFRAWNPDTRMIPGLFDIPVPDSAEVVHPTILFVPLLGFDAAGYRLGYGGGFYDRTLTSLPLLPVTIGVGYENGRLASICPQQHDVPMDAIVTEYQFKWCDGFPAAERREILLGQGQLRQFL
jgi:5-formyltetrahydrofolate cyclo-ligase